MREIRTVYHPELLQTLYEYVHLLRENNPEYRKASHRLGDACEDYAKEGLKNLKYKGLIDSFTKTRHNSKLDRDRIDFMVHYTNQTPDYLQITASPNTAWKKEGEILRAGSDIFVIPVFDCYDHLVPLPIIEQSIMDWHQDPKAAWRNLWDYLNQPTDIQSVTNFGGKHRT